MNRGTGFFALEHLLSKIIRDHGLERKISEGCLLTKWPESVGAKIASVTEPVDIRDGKLFVKVSGAAWRSELIFLKPTIQEKLNQIAGRKVISEIVFI